MNKARIRKDEFGTKQKDVTVTSLEVISHHLLGGTSINS
jgi:hypothetical protein